MSKSKYQGMRSGEAVAAQHRNAGPMRHRLQPRGGSRNLQMEYLTDETDDQKRREEYTDEMYGAYEG